MIAGLPKIRPFLLQPPFRGRFDDGLSSVTPAVREVRMFRPAAGRPAPPVSNRLKVRTDMKRSSLAISVSAVIFAMAALPAQAAKPSDPATGLPYGNGFPSGSHFNLNLLGKNDTFACPAPEYDELGNQVFGKVIFFPRVQGNDPISVLMESGTKGPKGATGTTSLEVTDWCTESFPDYGQNTGDGAVLRLPANAAGYAVYGRLTGKPPKEGETTVSITPDLVYVSDEAGNDLVLLGIVDSDGIATFSMTGATLNRTDSTTSGKGVRKATNLTGLFEWSGEACYVQADVTNYCYDEGGNYICSTQDLCCADVDPADGIYEACGLLADVGVDDGSGVLSCPSDPTVEPYLPLAVSSECRSYENEWVFNIGDFVGYLWDLDSTGAYVVQIRFYPL
jgi:hypothetical protein